ncbi:MAG: hypothetical protein R6W90_18510 [Ignavibacteriaceae bacterium]
MQKILLLFIVTFFYTINISPQHAPVSGFEFLPPGLNFMPLKANNQEAKIGVLYHTATTNLKVDIGNNIDLFGYNFPQSSARLTAGIEFLAYALSTSYKGNRLQIDAVDGFFGGNLSYSQISGDGDKVLVRLRIIHNSAHFVDGHYDAATKQWIDNLEPNPYTEDFGELTAGHQLNFNKTIFKYFGGFSYSTLIRPSDLNRYNFHAGFELAYPFGKLAGKDENIFLANYINTDGIGEYIINQQTMLGVKFGNWEEKGILLYLSYYTGGDIFGSYYKRKISKFAVGFSVDFP